jgi:hypothetical protein
MAITGFSLFPRRLHAQELVQQSGRKAPDPGPRAIGLVQLSSKGKGRLIPIAIMLDGKFFDAGSYKATPVPMALDFGVIYEGFKTGVSQGLFTITQPGQLNHNWVAEGTWLPDGAKMQTKTKKYAPPVIEDDDSKSDRPTLHRRKEGAADKDDSKSSAGSNSGSSNSGSSNSGTSNSTTASPNSTGSSPSTSSSPSTTSSPAGSSTSPGSTSSGSPSGSAPSTSQPNDSAKPASSSSRASASDEEPISDPNRPVLRRGKPNPNAHHEPYVNFDDAAETPQAVAGAKTTSNKGASAATDSEIYQVFAAVSDAKGPDARPYTYDLKPAEEAIYRNKMLELAAALIKTNGRPSPPAPASHSARKSSSNPSPKAKDQFEDVHLRAFDLSFSNEPTLILSARTPVPPAGAPAGQVPKEITLVARTDLEGDLQKLFFAQTDSRHLDVSPRMELIDAVDADGDGRGELLFRQTSDAGSGYAIYRVSADKLWPLYENTP